MRTRNAGAMVLLAGLALSGLAPVAYAQDKAQSPDAPKARGAKKASAAKKATDTTKSATATPATQEAPARAEAVRTVPKWQAFGAGTGEESQEETFFRLAQDFVATAEIGARRLGHVPLWPRGNLKIGGFRVLPYLREGVEYETNVFRRPQTDRFDGTGFNEGRRAGYSWVTNAGVLADTMLMGGRLRLAASADVQFLQRFRDEQPDTREFDAQIGASYRWANGISARGGIAYERREDPIEIQETSQFERSNRRGFWAVNFDRDILFGSKVKTEVGMSVRDVTARESGVLDRGDRTEVEYYLKLSYPFLKEQTRIFGRLRYREDNREDEELNDGHVIGFDAGVEGDFPIFGGQTRGLRGSVSVGFDHGEYEDETFTRPGGEVYRRDDDSSNTNLAIRAALQYTAGPRTVFDLRAIRTNQFSGFGNYQIVDRADLTMQHTITSQLIGRVAFFGERSNPSNQVPLRRVDVSNSGTRFQNTRSATRWGAGVGARYTITDWTDLDLSYDYERRNAADDRGYTNHRVSLGITFYLTALKPTAKRSPVR